MQGGSNESRAIVTPVLGDGKITIDDNLFTGAFAGKYGSDASWHRGIWTDGGGVDITITDNTFANVRSAINYDDTSGDSQLVTTGNAFDKVGTGISFARADAAGNVDNNYFNDADAYLNFRNVTTPVTYDFGTHGNTTNDADPGSIEGGSASDTLIGGDSTDVLLGNGGADVLSGGADDDVLFGGDGADVLYGGAGNDLLIGNDAVTSDAAVDSVAYSGTIALSASRRRPMPTVCRRAAARLAGRGRADGRILCFRSMRSTTRAPVGSFWLAAAASRPSRRRSTQRAPMTRSTSRPAPTPRTSASPRV